MIENSSFRLHNNAVSCEAILKGRLHEIRKRRFRV